MRVNPPSKIVKGLAEGTLRTTATHLEKGDVMLVMESSATSVGDLKAAPPVAPKRAFWVTVRTVGISAIVADDEKGDAHIILDMAPQTAVTIRDREIIEPATVATVPACPDCVMPLSAGHACLEFMLTARADHLATLSWGTRGKVKRSKSRRPRKLMRGKVAA